MCISRTTLERHHSLISSFVSCLVCFPCSFAPCYEVLMTPEPFKKFRYRRCETSSHGLRPIVLCLWLPLSFDLKLQLCLASGAVSIISLGTAVGLGQALWNFLDPARTRKQHHSARSLGCLER